MPANDELEDDEAEARACREGGVQEPEVCGGPFLEEAAHPADRRVGGEERQVVEADDGGVDGFGRVAGEEREADREHVSEGDAVEEVEGDRPEESDLLSR